NTQDSLAASMVPELIRALNGANLTPAEAQSAQLLRGWNGTMSLNSPEATIWWYFINQYLQATFGPWWKAKRVPVSHDPNLALKTTSTVGTPLVDDLEAWTANDPANPAFSLPDGTRRSAAEVMRQAFQRAVALLTKKLGKDPNQWQWGKVHFRDFASLTQIPELGYGPRPSGGDSWTVNAADGGLVSHAGPSWRMIVNWQGPGKTPFAESVYPGGQSENPVSPWYENQIPAWWTGHYYRMESFLQAKHEPGAAVWTLNP
ncbi:MAG: penicillin acylase family protein, partial [Thermaerobacter sp.]|nr:penicillin acylase family protein [Thermaerobacter sp.]